MMTYTQCCTGSDPESTEYQLDNGECSACGMFMAITLGQGNTAIQKFLLLNLYVTM